MALSSFTLIFGRVWPTHLSALTKTSTSAERCKLRWQYFFSNDTWADAISVCHSYSSYNCSLEGHRYLAFKFDGTASILKFCWTYMYLKNVLKWCSLFFWEWHLCKIDQSSRTTKIFQIMAVKMQRTFKQQHSRCIHDSHSNAVREFLF